MARLAVHFLFSTQLTGKLFRYHEKSLREKLEIFTQRNLYVLAIHFAQKANLDVSQRNIILRKYGDYLYQKGDYDTAMQQYLKAIDNTEPSQVIRKVLNSSEKPQHGKLSSISFWILKEYTTSLNISKSFTSMTELL